MPKLLMYKARSEEISGMDTSSIMKAIEQCVELDTRGKTTFNIMVMSTDAYDDDPRALYDIPEMRRWCGAVFAELPHIFVVFEESSARWFLACIAPIKIHGRTATSTPYEYIQPATNELIESIEQSSRVFLKTVLPGAGQVQEYLDHTMVKVRAACL